MRNGASVRALAAAGLAALALNAGCGDGVRSAGEMSVPLITRPTEVSAIDPFVATGGRPASSIVVFVEPVTDERTDNAKVGQNLEEEKPVSVKWSGTSPADFVRAAFERGVQEMGLRVTTSKSEATHVLNARLIQFNTTERNTYVADVRTVVSIAHPAGSALWEGPATAQATRFGRSLSAENYQEVFTDATQRMVATALNAPGAREALGK